MSTFAYWGIFWTVVLGIVIYLSRIPQMDEDEHSNVEMTGWEPKRDE